MAYVAGRAGTADRAQPEVALLGVVFLGIAGFGLQAGPVYTGPGDTAGYLTWPAAAGLALLLAGLLAIPARADDAAQQRVTVAVLSAFGLLTAVMGVLDRPIQAGIGWALVAIPATAAVQTVLAMLALLPRQPAAARTDSIRPPVPEATVPHFPAGTGTTGFAVADQYPPTPADGFADNAADGVAQPREEPVFIPPASPAACGAQPSAGPAPYPSQPPWGALGQARVRPDTDGQPVRNESPI